MSQPGPGQPSLEAHYLVCAILSRDLGLYPVCCLIHCWGLGRYLSLCCFFIKTCPPANWDSDEWKVVNSAFSNFEHIVCGTTHWSIFWRNTVVHSCSLTPQGNRFSCFHCSCEHSEGDLGAVQFTPGDLSLEMFSEAHVLPWFAVNASSSSAGLRHARGSPAVCSHAAGMAARGPYLGMSCWIGHFYSRDSKQSLTFFPVFA